MFLAIVEPGSTASKAAPTAQDEARLVDLVRAIRSADYRGERERLRQLAADLDQVQAASLLAYREYWRGFARWRRAMNGFNEKAGDLREDLEGAVSSFKAAL